MEKWFIKSFKQRKTNFMGYLRKRVSPEQIIQRNWSYKIQIFKIAAKAEKDKTQKQSQNLGSPILIVVSVICRDQCIYYLYYTIVY